jgi:hypothetical protein
LLQNTIEQLKNVSLHEAQSNSITEQERKGFIFNMVKAFEDFALRYGRYRLSESMPELKNFHSKLGKYIIEIQISLTWDKDEKN